MREKRIHVAGNEFVVRMDEQRVDRITRSWPYRQAIRPALKWLEGRWIPSTAPTNGQELASGQTLDPHTEVEAVPVIVPRAAPLQADTPEQRAIVERIREHSDWYHTIDVGNGVLTPGFYDHEPALPHFPIPSDLTGKRCLDVATLDGFWAFEMERRGADEVMAMDIESWDDLDLPPRVLQELRSKGVIGPIGTGFEIASELLASRVQKRIRNVYDLSPEDFGQFDLVFCGDLLVHVTNPLHVLQNIYSVTRDIAIIYEPYSPSLDAAGLGPIAQLVGLLDGVRWWQFGRDYLARAIQLAGFARVEYCGTVDIRTRTHPLYEVTRAIFRAFRDPLPQGQQAEAACEGAH